MERPPRPRYDSRGLQRALRTAPRTAFLVVPISWSTTMAAPPSMGKGGSRSWKKEFFTVLQLVDDVRTSRRVAVAIHAPDPITRAGAMSHLRQYPEITLVDDPRQDGADVALLIADAFDETVLSRLSRLVRAEKVGVVLVLDRIREAELLDVVACGVTTIVWRREATGARLRQAVLAAEKGGCELPPDLLAQLIGHMGRLQEGKAGGQGAASVALGMVPREVDVLRLVADGMDTAEIAVELAYSERTVKNILHTVTTRFQLRNRAHAVAYALREGYI
ncbi:LuxR C-terminal-related transcriptional regulator [Streptomyces lavendulae]|uniref:helix-turn-helix transcriptional regulator n=1 Tax=Streptomyces lavendulae TaxID=1914 RepID=UPI00341043B0